MNGTVRNLMRACLAMAGVCAAARSAFADVTRRDIVYRSPDGYLVYERLFGEWLRKKM